MAEGQVDRSEWPQEAQDVIARLEKRLGEVNSESASRKEKMRAMEEERAQEREKVEAQRRAEKEAATNALKEQGKYKPLYEEGQRRIAELEKEGRGANLSVVSAIYRAFWQAA